MNQLEQCILLNSYNGFAKSNGDIKMSTYKSKSQKGNPELVKNKTFNLKFSTVEQLSFSETQELIDFRDEPIFLVSRAMSIVLSNKPAEELMGYPMVNSLRKNFSKLFECKYAGISSNCTELALCNRCLVKMAIHHTFTTGQRNYLRHTLLGAKASSSTFSSMSASLLIRKVGSLVMVALYS